MFKRDRELWRGEGSLLQDIEWAMRLFIFSSVPIEASTPVGQATCKKDFRSTIPAEVPNTLARVYLLSLCTSKNVLPGAKR